MSIIGKLKAIMMKEHTMGLLELIENEPSYYYKEKENIIDVWHISSNGQVNQETYLSLRHENDLWSIYNVIRNNKEWLEFQCKEKQIAEIGFYVLIKYLYTSISRSFDQEIQLSLYELEADDEQRAIEILNESIGEKYFSFLQNEPEKVNLSRNGENFDIYYLSLHSEKIMISKNREAPIAFGVLYNYSFILRKFMDEIYPVISVYPCTAEDMDMFKRLYLKGSTNTEF